MKLNENGKMTVYMIGQGDLEHEVERPEWLSYQGWKELVGLFPDDSIYYYDDVRNLLSVLSKNIIDKKDTEKDLIHSLQLSIVSKVFEIHMIQDLIKSSKYYKKGEITDLIVNA